MKAQITNKSEVNGQTFTDFYNQLSDSGKTQIKLILGINNEQTERFKEGLFFVYGTYRKSQVFKVMKSYGYVS